MDLIFNHQELLSDIWSEFELLAKSHHMELYNNDPKHEFNLDSNWYGVLEQNAQLHLTTIRNGNNELVGYLTCAVAQSPHHGHLCAYGDLFYLMPKYRNGFTVIRLFQVVKMALYNLGVKEIHFQSNNIKSLDWLFEYLGYSNTFTVYSLELE